MKAGARNGLRLSGPVFSGVVLGTSGISRIFCGYCAAKLFPSISGSASCPARHEKEPAPTESDTGRGWPLPSSSTTGADITEWHMGGGGGLYQPPPPRGGCLVQ